VTDRRAAVDAPGEWILGFDVGGTKTAVVAGTSGGEVLDRRTRASEAEAGFEPMWVAMTALADELIAARGRPAAIGVSIGGPLDSERGVVYSPPNLPGWDAVPLADRLRERFGVPALVEHDAKAGALAEWLFGAARGCRNVVYLTFGTGLGAGLILDGRLYRGRGDNAGEVGHWRMSRRGPEAYGKVGSWEAFASGGGLPGLARHLCPDHAWPDGMTARQLVSLAREGDPAAVRVVRASAMWLGRGVAFLVDLLDPDIVVLGSLAVRAGDLFLPTVRSVVARECIERTRECPIVSSELGERSGDLAALCAAIYRRQLAPARAGNSAGDDEQGM
jgi:glucokinase